MSDRPDALPDGFCDTGADGLTLTEQFRAKFMDENILPDLAQTFEAEDEANDRANRHLYTGEPIFPARHRLFWRDQIARVLGWVLRATRAANESDIPANRNDAEAAWRLYWRLEDFARAHLVLSRVFRDEMDRVTERRGAPEPADPPPVDWDMFKDYDVSNEIKESLRARAREVARGDEGSLEREYDAQWVATVWISNERFDALRTLVDTLQYDPPLPSIGIVEPTARWY